MLQLHGNQSIDLYFKVGIIHTQVRLRVRGLEMLVLRKMFQT